MRGRTANTSFFNSFGRFKGCPGTSCLQKAICAQESKHFHSENKWFLRSTGDLPPETRGRLFSTTDSLSGGLWEEEG